MADDDSLPRLSPTPLSERSAAAPHADDDMLPARMAQNAAGDDAVGGALPAARAAPGTPATPAARSAKKRPRDDEPAPAGEAGAANADPPVTLVRPTGQYFAFMDDAFYSDWVRLRVRHVPCRPRCLLPQEANRDGIRDTYMNKWDAQHIRAKLRVLWAMPEPVLGHLFAQDWPLAFGIPYSYCAT
jgi:hypothetical protein